jgi:hypothetical protein
VEGGDCVFFYKYMYEGRVFRCECTCTHTHYAGRGRTDQSGGLRGEHICTYMCIYMRLYIHIYINMYMRMYVHIYVYIYAYVCMYVCTYQSGGLRGEHGLTGGQVRVQQAVVEQSPGGRGLIGVMV